MEFNRRGGSAGGNAMEIQYGNSGNNVNETGVIGSTDQAVYATKEVVWNLNTKSKPSHERKLFQFKMGSQRPNKRARNSPLLDLMADDRSKAIGNVFFKTKLCCEFKVGTCPFINNCNYAHGIEELRELPPNLEEIVAAHKEEQVKSLEPREVFRIQNLGFVDKAPLPNMRRHCRKFLTEECSQYGENCYSIYNEQYEDRVSEAICLLPGTRSKSNLNSSNWKTRMCNKWELTGWCPFDDKCHFAHGSAELRGYNGRPEAGNLSTCDANQTALPAKASAGNVDVPAISVPRSYHVRNRSRRLPNVIPKTEEIPTRKWKGPNKISKLYGDWIDDL